jgi:hypothetical protein
MGKSAAEMLTGVKGPAYRLNVLLPEGEYRYLYALLTEHDPVSDTGKAMLKRLLGIMGDKIDEINKYGK